MSKRRDTRIVRPSEVRVADGGRTLEAVVLTYNVIDDYNTVFRPGCFAESLEARLPRICWAHRWDEPLGRWVDYRDTDTELTLIGELDDFDAVPRARQASAQLESGTIDQFSVGFLRLADEMVDPEEFDTRGVTAIVKGQLDEASLVLVGAVPNTKLLALRSGMVPEPAVVEFAKKVAAGEMTADEAKIALSLLADSAEPAPEAAVVEADAEESPPPVVEVDAAEVDAAVDLALNRSVHR